MPNEESIYIKNLDTGQSMKAILPLGFSALSKIGITDDFTGLALVKEDGGFYPDRLGIDGRLTLDELQAYLVQGSYRSFYRFDYMMLDQLKQGCDYFLRNGKRSVSALNGGSVEEHIFEMKRIWRKIPNNAKPEWLTADDILQYERKMMSET
ncbi:LPD11 domain-containing protein [Streptococcus sobrinus]|uniref:LPD11 domain-containing protein n=1 Tax=Streptococcus sobrinus TaxID=1310 RepID=UPI0002DEF65C|nr:LPD11 domain-containing protein [Streptococcus sobrinus]